MEIIAHLSISMKLHFHFLSYHSLINGVSIITIDIRIYVDNLISIIHNIIIKKLVSLMFKQPKIDDNIFIIYIKIFISI